MLMSIKGTFLPGNKKRLPRTYNAEVDKRNVLGFFREKRSILSISLKSFFLLFCSSAFVLLFCIWQCAHYLRYFKCLMVFKKKKIWIGDLKKLCLTLISFHLHSDFFRECQLVSGSQNYTTELGFFYRLYCSFTHYMYVKKTTIRLSGMHVGFLSFSHMS